MHAFQQFETDRVSLCKADGTEIRSDIAASVHRGKISIYNSTLAIEVGDIITRTIPSGIVEEYVVDDPGYRAAFHDIPARYQIRCHRADAPRHQPEYTIQASGPNARINIGSNDYSNNILVENRREFELVIEEIRTALATVQPPNDEALLTALLDLKGAYGSPSLLNKYQAFIATAANHMTLIAPLIPMLTPFLSTPH
jgi:hypothetical protein